MELVLDRNLSDRRIYPSIDINRSGTRREDKLIGKKRFIKNLDHEKNAGFND